MNNLPQKLYDLRKSRGLLQEELAEKLGVSRQAISKWEMGTGVPTLENLIGISEFFGVTLDSLVKDEYETAVSSSAEKSPAPMYAEAESVSPTEPSVAKKIIMNILTVIAVRVLMLCVSQFLALILETMQSSLNINGFSSPLTYDIFAIMGYALDILTLLPYFFVLYMIFDRNKSLLSRPLFDKNEPLSKRLGVKKVMLVFLIRLFIDVATHVVIIRFSLDITWAGCTTVFEHFLMYAIFTHGKPNIFQNAKALVATALISASSYAVAALMSYYQVKILLHEFSISHMTRPLTFSVLFYLTGYAIVCAFVIFHGIWTEKNRK